VPSVGARSQMSVSTAFVLCVGAVVATACAPAATGAATPQAPVTAAVAPAPASAPPVTGQQGDSGRHGGRGGGGGAAAGTVAWPSGIPVPPGTVQQTAAVPGLWQMTTIDDEGLEAARSAVAARYVSAGFTPDTRPAPGTAGPQILHRTGWTVTVETFGYDHSGVRTEISVHLQAA
jgi:hypothetical protein